jgi:hypothetical protein
MMSINPRYTAAIKLVFIVLISLLVIGRGYCQPSGASPSDLIKFLTYQSQERANQPHVFGCGIWNVDRSAARSLGTLGDGSLPALQGALDSIEERGQRSEFAFNAGWLVLAYARIRDHSALPRLLRMLDNPNDAFLALDIDDSIALALNITSYVSETRQPVPRVHCGRPQEPRDALDNFILGWERNDRTFFESALGPNGREGLRRVLAGRTWAAMRGSLYLGKSLERASVGYKFQPSGAWSQPEETLLEETERGPQSSASVEHTLDTTFVGRSGIICGHRNTTIIEQVIGNHEIPSHKFFVDDSHIDELLKLISTCAAQ